MKKRFSRKSQASTDTLILLSIVLIIIVVIVSFTFRSRQDIVVNKAASSLDTITDYSSQVAELGPGNKVKTKVEIPSIVESMGVANGEVTMVLTEGVDGTTDIHRLLKTNVVGFITRNPKPGIYDLIFESFGSGVCVYPPGKRAEYCYCFSDEANLHEFEFRNDYNEHYAELLCETNGITKPCDSDSPIRYNDLITGFKSQVLNKTDLQVVDATVTYKVINWKNETVFESSVFNYVGEGYFNLSNANYIVENSGPLNITTTAYHECYYVSEYKEKLSTTATVTVDVPYGRLVPFLLDENGRKIYQDESHYYLVDPTNSDKSHLKRGWVKSGDTFIIRTGFECLDGECVNVNASLYHSGNP